MKHYPSISWPSHVLRTALVMVCTLVAAQPSIASVLVRIPVINGIATTQDGRPLPRATLFLLGIPPGESWDTPLGDATTVVTDDHGRFTWTVPEHAAIFPNDKSSPPPCWALAANRSVTSYSVRTAPSSDNDNSRRDLLERASRQCVTHWIDPETNPVLAVTAPNTGQISLTIRGADARPLRRRRVKLFSPETFSNFEGAVIYDGTTDETGRLTTRWYAGVRRIKLIVPGVGFGSTGIVEGRPARETTAPLPPLAPFSLVSGVVSPALRSPAAVVALDAFGFSGSQWYRPTAAIAANGAFLLTGVLPGEYRVVLSGESDAAESQITVGPGERVTGVVLAPAPPAAAAPQANAPQANAPHTLKVRMAAQSTKVPPVAKPEPQSLRGTVTDTDGHPVAGATVYAICTRLNTPWTTPTEILLTAFTDTAGQYVIPKLPGGSSGVSILLIASHAGFARAQASAVSGKSGPAGDLQADLVLPSLKTGLSVRVVRNGQPVPGALVRIAQFPRYDVFEANLRLQPYNPDAYDAVAQLMAPEATTDANGQALFQGVSPGVWSLIAADAVSAAHVPHYGQRAVEREIRRAIDRGEAQGVIVRAGQTADFTVKLFDHPDEVSFQVLGPDGKPPADPEISLVSSQFPWFDNGGQAVTLDAAGLGRQQLFTPGLWRAAAIYFHGPFSSNPPQEPFYRGDTLFAVAPSVPEPGPTVIHTTLHNPGSIRVRLENTDGTPARGAVVVGGVVGFDGHAGSMNSEGTALFEGMPSGSYPVIPGESGEPAPSLGKNGDPFPTDDSLTGVSLFLPQTVPVWSNSETAATIRRQPQGYIRGSIRVPGKLSDYILYAPNGPSSLARTHLDTATGEFVAGPFPSGKALLALSRTTPGGIENASRWETSIPVVPGKVVHVTLVPEETTASTRATPWPVMTMRTAQPYSRPMPLSGTVLLSDGVTPAWGARAAVMVPRIGVPVTSLRANAAGRLIEWDYTGGSESRTLEGPSVPVVVAWLPGESGASIVPYVQGREVRIVLPEPLSVKGRVTVGGQSVAGIDSSFRIRAAYQGRGKLNPLLSVDATAQPDGSFVLAGLTPGTYLVQAARDGIWVSSTWTLRVGPDALADLALDIPLLGQATDLSLVNGAGTPLPGAVVHISLPEGPLTDEIWPKSLNADAAGILHLEGLAAGTVRISVFAAPEHSLLPAGSVPAGSVPAGTPLASIILNVSPWVLGAPSIKKTIHCGSASETVTLKQRTQAPGPY